jgi:hypothetical protein
MKKILLILGLLFGLSPTLHAQTQTTVIGTVNDPLGNLATSGYVTFTIKPSSASILYHIQNLNILAPVTGRCGINASGLIKSNANLLNPCLVWGNNVITPGNTTYDVQFFPNGTPSSLIHQLLISGTTYDLSAPIFAPQVQINPQYQTIHTSPIAVNLVPVSDNLFNVGQSGLRYANGYFTNLTVSGNCSGCGIPPGTNGDVVKYTSANTVGDAGYLASDVARLSQVNAFTGLNTFSVLQTFSGGITGTGNTGTLLPGTGILGTANTWTASQTFTATMNAHSVLPTATGTYTLGTIALPWYKVTIGNAANQTTTLSSQATVNQGVTFPDAAGVVALTGISQVWAGLQTSLVSDSHPLVEYCGATSGATQACAKTQQTFTFVTYGDVTLNTATTQSITTLPFTTSTFSCSGSDLTTAAGIVSFNTYAAGSVTIAESGGVNTDHLRYQCVGK